MDAAVDSIAPGVHAGSLVIFETTLPVGDTRGRFAPRLEAATGLRADEDFFVAFSPERLYSGAALRNLATYPKLVGGIGAGVDGPRGGLLRRGPRRRDRGDVDAPRRPSSRKLADTTYRDVNIALANEFARYAERVGVDIHEVIAAANSQPYSHIHQPGLGVGGHCIPVYPHFLLSRAPELEMVALSRRTNDGQVGAGDQGAPAGARRARRRADPRPRPDLPPRRQGAGLLAGAAADRAARPTRARSCRPTTRCSSATRPPRCCATPWVWGDAGAVPGDRHPDRRSAVRDARSGLVPGARGRLRRPRQPARPRTCPTASRIAASACRGGRGSPPRRPERGHGPAPAGPSPRVGH